MLRKQLELSGQFFEFLLKDEIEKSLPGSVVIHDTEVYCPSLGQDTQIDLIVITDKSLTIIEAKNWTDWLSGNVDDIRWQGKSRSKNVLTIFNPVNQNKLHIRAFRNYLRSLGIDPPKMQNLVCVPDGTKIKTDSKCVCNFSDVVSKLKAYEYQSLVQIDKSVMRKICENLQGKGVHL